MLFLEKTQAVLQEHFNQALPDYNILCESKLLQEFIDHNLLDDLLLFEDARLDPELNVLIGNNVEQTLTEQVNLFVLSDIEIKTLTQFLANETIFISEPYPPSLAVMVVLFLLRSSNELIISQFLTAEKLKGLMQRTDDFDKKTLMNGILASQSSEAIKSIALHLDDYLEIDNPEKAKRIQSILASGCTVAIRSITKHLDDYLKVDLAEKKKRIQSILSSQCSEVIKLITKHLIDYLEVDDTEKSKRIRSILASHCPEAIKLITKHLNDYLNVDAPEKAIRIQTILGSHCPEAIKFVTKENIFLKLNDTEKVNHIRSILASQCSDAIKSITKYLNDYLKVDDLEKAKRIQNILASHCPHAIKSITNYLRDYLKVDDTEKAKRIQKILNCRCPEASDSITEHLGDYLKVDDATKAKRMQQIMASRCAAALQNSDIHLNWFVTEFECSQNKMVNVGNINKIIASRLPIFTKINFIKALITAKSISFTTLYEQSSLKTQNFLKKNFPGGKVQEHFSTMRIAPAAKKQKLAEIPKSLIPTLLALHKTPNGVIFIDLKRPVPKNTQEHWGISLKKVKNQPCYEASITYPKTLKTQLEENGYIEKDETPDVVMTSDPRSDTNATYSPIFFLPVSELHAKENSNKRKEPESGFDFFSQ